MRKLKGRIKRGNDGKFDWSWYNTCSHTVSEEHKFHALERKYSGKYFN